jgi:hypothetical protein
VKKTRQNKKIECGCDSIQKRTRSGQPISLACLFLKTNTKGKVHIGPLFQERNPPLNPGAAADNRRSILRPA